jgi:hypothetical protein
MLHIRSRIRSPARIHKAGHLLRGQNRPVLEWLLGPPGPLLGNAQAYLVDKAYLVVRSVVDLLGGDGATADTLYRAGRRGFDREPWEAFLVSANNLMRPKDRSGAGTSVDSFLRTLDVLDGTGAEVDGILRSLREAAPGIGSWLSPLDPLVPAIVRAVEYWGVDAVVHDRQKALSGDRLARLGPVSLRLVDAESDTRVQVADIMAGVARKLASDELNRRGDAELTALLRPYVDPASIWADERSWTALGR